jgi:hypothetical protein
VSVNISINITILYFNNFPDMKLYAVNILGQEKKSVLQCGIQIFIHLHSLHSFVLYINQILLFILLCVELLWLKFKKQNIMEVKKDNQEQTIVVLVFCLYFI